MSRHKTGCGGSSSHHGGRCQGPCDSCDQQERRKIEQLIVPNLAALSKLKHFDRKFGTEAFVQTLDQSFQFDPNSTATPDGITVIAARCGGNWLRLLSHAPRFTAQLVWFFDAVNGNNENDGATAATAVQSLAEIARRLQYISFSNYLVNLLSDVPAGDTFDLDPNFDSKGVGPSLYNVTFLMLGQQTVNTTGTVSASTFTTPSANLQGTITAAPINWANFIGKLVVITSGPLTGATAWVLKDLGANTARMSNWYFPPIGEFPDVGHYPAVPPAPNTTFAIMDLTTINIDLRFAGDPSRVILRLKNVRLSPTSVVTVEDADTEMVTTQWNSPTLPLPRGMQINARTRFFGSLLAPPTPELVLFDLRMRADGSAFLNLNLDMANTIKAEILNCTSQGGKTGGEVRVGKFFSALVIDSSPAQGQMGVFDGTPLGANLGFGIFDSPGNGLLLLRRTIVTFDAPLFGSGNALKGADISSGASLLIRDDPADIPTITGTGGELQIDNGAIIPIINPVTGVPGPGAAPVTSWATGPGSWADPGTYNKNLMNLANGTNIISTTAP